jgi:hypothetical protein
MGYSVGKRSNGLMPRPLLRVILLQLPLCQWRVDPYNWHRGAGKKAPYLEWKKNSMYVIIFDGPAHCETVCVCLQFYQRWML